MNKHLTIRNWLVGFYIVEFEQKGEDRAKYGDRLLEDLAKEIKIKGFSETNLIINRKFYNLYPQIRQTLPDELKQMGFPMVSIPQLPSEELSGLQVPPQKLINRLSFSHLTLLFPIDDSLKRTFYEIECIKGNWSVSELKRQINSLYFERSGMSNILKS